MGAKKDKYYCKDCQKQIGYTQCIEHHKKGHEVWHVNGETGEMDYRYGESGPKEEAKITAESGRDIREHTKGFVEPDDEILFIYYKGGRIQRFWDRFGEHYSIYRALTISGYWKGTPAEFVDASARYMLAVAGF
jgi:hypothetical protein